MRYVSCVYIHVGIYIYIVLLEDARTTCARGHVCSLRVATANRGTDRDRGRERSFFRLVYAHSGSTYFFPRSRFRGLGNGQAALRASLKFGKKVLPATERKRGKKKLRSKRTLRWGRRNCGETPRTEKEQEWDNRAGASLVCLSFFFSRDFSFTGFVLVGYTHTYICVRSVELESRSRYHWVFDICRCQTAKGPCG